MDHNRFQVIYKGEFLEGGDREKAYRTAAVVLSVSETKVRQLLNGQRVVLKKGLDESSARGMCAALKQAGIRVALGVPRDQLGEAGQASGNLGLQPATAKLPLPSKPLGATDIGRGTAKIPMAAKAPAALNAPGDILTQAERPAPSPAALASRVPFEFHGSGSEYSDRRLDLGIPRNPHLAGGSPLRPRRPLPIEGAGWCYLVRHRRRVEPT